MNSKGLLDLSRVEVLLQASWRRLYRWGYRCRWLFVVTLLASVAGHYVIYANHLQNFDSLHIGSLYIADFWEFSPRWETQQGRWGLRFVDMLRGGINHAPLSAFLLLLLYTLAALLVLRLLQVRARPLRWLIPLTVVLAPYTAEVETYHYCSAAYALSFFLAVLAVVPVVFCKVRWRFLPGALCLLLALSLYQASLNVAAGLSLMILILQLLRSPQEPRTTLCLAGQLLAMGAAGTAGYYLWLKFFLRYYDTSLAGINGINLVGLDLIRHLPEGLGNAYQDFGCYFFDHNIAQNYYGQRLAYLLLFVLTLVVVLRWLVTACHPRGGALVLTLLALLPAATNLTDVINPNTRIELRMAGALVLLVPFCLALLDRAPRKAGRLPWSLAAASLCGLILLRGYVVQINNDAMVMLAQKNKIVNLANRICLQLEQNADYQAGAQVCILGEPQKGVYDTVSPLTEKASDLAQFGLLSFDPTFNSRGWHSLYWEELGIQMNWCSDEQTRALCATDTFQEMPVYPQEGSIQIIDDVVVVKVAPIR